MSPDEPRRPGIAGLGWEATRTPLPLTDDDSEQAADAAEQRASLASPRITAGDTDGIS